MTSVGTKTTTTTTTTASSAIGLVGRHGMGRFGTKNPAWYACVVKAHNGDGTIKVQWEEDKKFTFRLPVEKFRLEQEAPVEPEFPIEVLFKTDEDGDY